MSALPGEWISAATIALGLLGGLGLWAVMVEVTSTSRGRGKPVGPPLLLRIAHSVSDVSPAARAMTLPREDNPLSVLGHTVGPGLRSLAKRLDGLLGGSESALGLLDRAGVNWTVLEYQLRRAMAGLGGASVGLLLGALVGLWRSWGVSLVLAIVSAVIGLVAGAALVDYWLRRVGSARGERIVDEFPTVMELLALALAAGESLHGALTRIAQRGSGEIGAEWARVLRQVDLGASLGPSLMDSADRMGVAELHALVAHLSSALERGAPLAEVVRSHSTDSRHERLRAIVERAGKAEVWMLVPLVLLILPITVIFAVWPSLLALQSGL